MSPVFARILRLCLLAPLLPLIACSGKSSATKPAAEDRAEPAALTITWSYWGDAWEQALNQRMIRAFERDYPGIRVQAQYRPWSEYFTWLRGQWAAGTSPDVMFLNYIPAYAALGELQPLEGYLARDQIAPADYYPALLEGFKANGHYYGLPRDNDTKVIYYNRAQFSQAGVPEPRDGWTWADLRAAATALTNTDAGRYGFGFEPEYWWLVWLWQNGGDVLDDPINPTAVRIDQPAAREALRYLQRLIQTDRVTPPPAQLNTDDMVRLFREGRLSMLFGNHTLVPAFTETPGLTWEIAPLPAGVARANVAGGAGFVVSRRSQNKDAAWLLVRYLTGAKAQAMLAESGVITPARRAISEDNIFLRQQPYRATVFVSETEYGRAVPNFARVDELYAMINRALAPVWRGEQSVDVAVDALAPQLRELLGLGGP